MQTIRIPRSSIIRGIVLVVVVAALFTLALALVRDVRLFHCCTARQFYFDHDVPEYAYCLELSDVRTGDGKDCGVWYLMQYFLWMQLVAGISISALSAVFMKRKKLPGIISGLVVAVSPAFFVVCMRIASEINRI